MIQQRTEFRFLIDKYILENIHIIPKDIIIIDYYLEREKRIRYIKKYPNILQENTFHLIEVSPGCIYKYPTVLEENEAKKLATWKNVKYLVKKKCIGTSEFNIGSKSLVEGYIEHIVGEEIVYDPRNLGTHGVKVLDEIHIEFETFDYHQDRLKNLIKPIEIINDGIFDYIEKKVK